MADWNAFLWICVGVIVGVVLPVLKGFVKGAFPATKAEMIVPAWVKKYGALLLFGGVTALLVLAGAKAQNPTLQLQWYTALLLGFSSEAFLEKLVQNP